MTFKFLCPPDRNLRFAAMDIECVVCYDATACALGGCGHRMCSDCIEKWCARRAVCPLCRQATYGPRLATKSSSSENARLVALAFSSQGNRNVGVTLAGDADTGIRVTHLDRNDLLFHAGLRVGDRVLSINTVPCRDHRASVDLLQAATDASDDLSIPIAFQTASGLSASCRRYAWAAFKSTRKRAI